MRRRSGHRGQSFRWIATSMDATAVESRGIKAWEVSPDLGLGLSIGFSRLEEGDVDAPAGSGKKVSRAAALAIAILSAVAIGVWLIADDAGLTMADTVIPVLVGGAVGLVVAIVLVLAVSRFRTAFSRMRTPSVLLLGGLGLWAWLLLEPTILIGMIVGLAATVYFLIVLALIFDPWHTRRSEQQEF